MALSREAVAEIKQRADIVQIIGERVSLRSSGGSFKGLCPFHAEKTPSFTVNPARGVYHCFGCGAGGSVIDFLMAFDRLSFPEAVGTLAARLGIRVETGGAPLPTDRALEVLEAATGFYHDALMQRPQGEAARRYLRERSFEEEAWQAFSLGFAPPGWQNFTAFASSRKLALDDQIAAGLVKRSDTGRVYDLLRNRVVFPIRDVRGACIGFGGRAIEAMDTPKYLNTPETRHYRKSRVLFGLAEGQAALRTSRRAILVEGYLDVIRLHGAGFAEALAPCGTALTAEHLELLERHSDRVVLLFDGDAAGAQAALRSAPLFLNRGLEARVATLPEGQDPDLFLLRQGKDAFAEILAGAVPIMEFLVLNTLARHGRSLAGKERTLRELAPVIAAIGKEAVRDLTIRFLADLVEVKAEDVFRMVGPRPKPGRASGRGEGGTGGSAVEPSGFAERANRHQRMFLRILLQERELVGRARELLKPDELTDPEIRRLFEKILALPEEQFLAGDPLSLAEQEPELAPALRGLLVEAPLPLMSGAERASDLQYEIALIKEAAKDTLLRRLKQVAGTPAEDETLRSYMAIRDELRALKSVPSSRSLTYDHDSAEAMFHRNQPSLAMPFRRI